MTNKAKEFPIDFKVDIEDGVGVIPPEAYKNNLPDGLTMDHVDTVHSYTDQFFAHAGHQLLDHAPTHFAQSDSDLTIAEYAVGEHGSVSMSLGKDYQLVTAITIAGNEALQVVEEKAKAIYLETLAAE